MWLKGNEHVRKYLERIVEYAIGHKLGEYTLGSNEAGLISISSIANKYDIILINNKKRFRYNVEMNGNQHGIDGIQRIYNKSDVYLGHMLADFYRGIEKNKRYEGNIEVEQINLNCFYAPEGKLIHRLDFEFVDLNYQITRSGVKSHQIYLPRIKDLCYDKYEEQEDIYKDLTMLLANSYKEMEKLASGNKEREEVVKYLKTLSKDDEIMAYIDREEFNEILRQTELNEAKRDAIKEGHDKGYEQGMEKGIEQGISQGIEQGIEQGIQKGIQKGIEQNQKKIAKEMVKQNFEKETIAKCLKIDVSKVNELLSND